MFFVCHVNSTHSHSYILHSFLLIVVKEEFDTDVTVLRNVEMVTAGNLTYLHKVACTQAIAAESIVCVYESPVHRCLLSYFVMVLCHSLCIFIDYLTLYVGGYVTKLLHLLFAISVRNKHTTA